jgi:putative ABC transport system permease protein
MNVVPLSYWDLGLASSLVIVNALISVALGLGLARGLLIAAVRMAVQLTLIGLVLIWLFSAQSPWWTLLVAMVMLAMAGYEVFARQLRRFSGLWAYGLGASTMVLASVLVTLLALTVLVQPAPWYDPRYAVPLLGMILGNTMTGVALGLDTLTTATVRDQAAVEARLALGHSRFDAMRVVSVPALRSGFIPIINTMAAAGVVALPGMMTGQILSGTPPEEAVKYQLLILFLIAGATGIGVLLAVYGGVLRLTDARHRLRVDRLVQPANQPGK